MNAPPETERGRASSPDASVSLWLALRGGWTPLAGPILAAIVIAAVSSAAEPIRRSEDTRAALEYEFSNEDELLLEEIQRGCFEFLWNEVGSPVPLVKDRLTNNEVASLGGVGFQLSALPIGVEHGWITLEQGEKRAAAILRGIVDRDDNKKHGIYIHFVDLNSGGMHQSEHAEVFAGTADHALLQAGAMTAAVYFGGEAKALADRIVRDANWKINEVELNENIRRAPSGHIERFVSFGWGPEGGVHDLSAPGSFRPWSWYKASDEELLVTFLAVGSPVPTHKVDPAMYYRLHRVVKGHNGMPPFAVSWSGTAFNYLFAHCWIDYRRFGTDDPRAFGSAETPIDWFENSRRAMATQRQRCLDSADRFKTFGPNRWGMSAASDISEDGTPCYIIQSVRPNIAERDDFCGGTVTPYAAGTAIMFLPEESVAALREFRHLKDSSGNHVVWHNPSEGGYGLLDSFNLDRRKHQGTPNYLSVDEGPMLLGIENARSGLVWELFMQHPSAKLAVKRLKFKVIEQTE